jgi:hypothetical protein
MKQLSIVLILITLIVAGFSCKKDKLLGEYHLTEELKSCNPFKGYETLRFQNERNMIELNGGDRINDVEKKYAYYPYEYYLCEADYIVFSDSAYSMQITMQACYSYPVAEGIEFRFNYLDSNYIFSSYYALLSNEYVTKYYDSLLISGSWIHEVYYDTMKFIFYDKPFPYEDLKYLTKSYYSKTFGVVKLDFSDGSTWELEEIVW